MPRNPEERKAVSWESRYGTTSSGNLPQYKVEPAVSAVITSSMLSQIQSQFPWVTMDDFHYYHIKCPYSTEANIHLVRDVVIGSSTYWQNSDVSAEAVSHTLTNGLMIRHSRGSKHGWLCVDPNCPYYLGTGSNYFYI